jgi:hypothetical protein
VYLWPDSAERVLKTGGKLALPLVAQGPLQSGGFSLYLPADSAAIAREAAGNGGYANFMVSVVAGDRSGAWFFTRSADLAKAAPFR